MSKDAVLVTGAAKRVGRALALHLAHQGHDIALHYHTSAAEAEILKREVEGLNVACELFACDLSDLESLPKLISSVLERFAGCRTLINNASRFEPGNFLTGSLQEYGQMMRINFESPMFLAQAFARQVAGGHVINLLDTKIADQKHSHFFYLLAKKCLRDFTLMAATELGVRCRINAVCPGYLLPSEGWTEDYVQRLNARLPLGKHAEVEDVCHAVAFLMESRAITGQLIYVDGGEHL
jgi:NAD(P)-dependent dehydrogenase (short-subunit alcohol dehydrogenase family)